jgi:hypothetical protein
LTDIAVSEDEIDRIAKDVTTHHPHYDFFPMESKKDLESERIYRKLVETM